MASRCEPCRPGFYGSGRGLVACTAAPEGTYSAEYGATSETRCVSGTYSSGTILKTADEEEYAAVRCESCPPGKMSGPAADSCLECELGKAAPRPGSSSCTGCKPGRFATLGAAECTACPAGMYAPEPAAMRCLECDINTVSQVGMAKCSICPDRSWTEGAVASSECTACPSGSVFPLNASANCLRCGAETYSIIPGENVQKTCHPCPPGALCSGGDSVVARMGQWRDHPRSLAFNPCPFAQSCLGSPTTLTGDPLNEFCRFIDADSKNGTNSVLTNTGANVSQQGDAFVVGGSDYFEGCAEGYTGVLCAACAPNFGKQGPYCTPCDATPGVDFSLAVGRLGFLLFLVCFYVNRTRKAGASIKPTPFATMVKISLAHTQIVSLALAYPILWPPSVRYLLGIFEMLGYFDALIPMGCALNGQSVYVSATLFLICPFIVFVVMAIWDILKSCVKKNAPKFSTRSFVPVVLLTSGLLYPTLVRKCFLFFTCIPIAFASESTVSENNSSSATVKEPFDPNDYTDIRYMLQARPSVPCFDAAHKAAVISVGVPSLLVYVIGVPLLSLVILLRHRKDIMVPRLDMVPDSVLKLIGYMFRAFEPEYYWWQVWRICRKTLMIMTTVFLNLIHPKVKVLSGVFLLAISVAAHIREMPFRNRRLDFFEEITLISQFMTFYLGMFFTSDSSYRIDETTSTIIAFFIVIVNVGVLAYLFAMLLLYTSHLKCFIRMRTKCCCKKCRPAPTTTAPVTNGKLSLKDRLKMAGHVVAKQNSNSLMRIVFNRSGKKAGTNRLFKMFGAQHFEDSIPPSAVPKCQFCQRQDPRHSYVVCSQCETALYCGKACQMEDWRKTHKDACKGHQPPPGAAAAEASETDTQKQKLFSFAEPSMSKSRATGIRTFTSEGDESEAGGGGEEGGEGDEDSDDGGGGKQNEDSRAAKKREELQTRRDMVAKSTKVVPQDGDGDWL